MIAAIWAQDTNGLIGKEGGLPWFLPNDLAFFKKITSGHAIVMGRTTFEGMGKRLLPNRQTVVLTSDKHYEVEGALVLHDVSEVLDFAKNYAGDTFIIGGSKVYEHTLDKCDRLYRTVIHHEFEGDTFIADNVLDGWHLIDSETVQPDEKNLYQHTFEIYEK